MQHKPLVRLDEVSTQEVGDELVVYDPRHQQAHRLNSIAASVFRYSDGTRTVRDIGYRVSSDHGLPEDEGVIWSALGELANADLLTHEVIDPSARSASRRGVLLAAALSAPMIISIAVPSPASAQSLGENGNCINVPCK